MVYFDPSLQQSYYDSILRSPGERAEVEFKSSFEFTDNNESLRLIKHIIGMANGGGGNIVIGYAEDNKKKYIPDPNHQESFCGSFDTTILSKKVNKYILGTEKLEVYSRQHPHPVTGIKYPIIIVGGFVKSPFFCKSNVLNPNNDKEYILKQGVIYIRNSAGETTEIKDPSDWEKLIKQCIQMSRDEFLRQFENLLRDKGIIISNSELSKSPISNVASEEPNTWINKTRKKALNI